MLALDTASIYGGSTAIFIIKFTRSKGQTVLMDRCGEASASAKLSALTLQDRSTFSVIKILFRKILRVLEKEGRFRGDGVTFRSGSF